MHVGAGAASHLVYELIGSYDDVIVRTSAGWRIQSRSCAPGSRLGPRDEVLGLVAPPSITRDG